MKRKKKPARELTTEEIAMCQVYNREKDFTRCFVCGVALPPPTAAAHQCTGIASPMTPAPASDLREANDSYVGEAEHAEARVRELEHEKIAFANAVADEAKAHGETKAKLAAAERELDDKRASFRTMGVLRHDNAKMKARLTRLESLLRCIVIPYRECIPQALEIAIVEAEHALAPEEQERK